MIDIQRFLDDYNIDYATSGKNVASGFININCPHCEDKSKHGGFPKNGSIYLCWRCGRHDIAETLSLITGISKKDIISIKKQYNNYIESNEEQYEYHNETILVPGGKLTKQHKDYLFGRNFDADFLERKYDLRGTLATRDLYAYRIITPIYYKQRIVSYQGRDFTGKQELRYVTCKPEFEIIHHKKILFNMDNATSDKVIVVEGTYDAFRFGDNTVATMGTGYTREQVSLLAKTYDEIYTMFDPEIDAQNRAKQLLTDLSMAGKKVMNIRLDSGDPAEQTEETVREIKKDLKLI